VFIHPAKEEAKGESNNGVLIPKSQF